MSGGAVYSFQPAMIVASSGGSLSFNGSTNALYTTNSADFNLGTGDFTIEWFQRQNTDRFFPRIFALGTYPSTDIGVSIEGNTFYFWGMSSIVTSFVATSYLTAWTHFAIVRHSGVVKIYENGVSKASTTYASSIGSSSAILGFGSEVDSGSHTSISSTYFDGKLTNFRWSKGSARYSSNFTMPISPFSTDANTQMLYLATDSAHYLDDATSNHALTDVSGSSVSWSSDSPF